MKASGPLVAHLRRGLGALSLLRSGGMPCCCLWVSCEEVALSPATPVKPVVIRSREQARPIKSTQQQISRREA